MNISFLPRLRLSGKRTKGGQRFGRRRRKEDLRLAAGLTTNMIANMGKEGKHISMDTLARICETLDCGIMDVIELASDEPSTTGGNDNGKTERKNHRERY